MRSAVLIVAALAVAAVGALGATTDGAVETARPPVNMPDVAARAGEPGDLHAAGVEDAADAQARRDAEEDKDAFAPDFKSQEDYDLTRELLDSQSEPPEWDPTDADDVLALLAAQAELEAKGAPADEEAAQESYREAQEAEAASLTADDEKRHLAEQRRLAEKGRQLLETPEAEAEAAIEKELDSAETANAIAEIDAAPARRRLRHWYLYYCYRYTYYRVIWRCPSRGYYWGGYYSCCRSCGRGYWCWKYSYSSYRYSCPVGRYGSSYYNGNSWCNGRCYNGYYCPSRSYSPAQSSCGAVYYYCPSGYRYRVANGYFSTPESRSIYYRYGQSRCPAAYYCPNNGRRYACNAGRYQPYTGRNFCYDCPSGYYAPTSGAYSSCRLCPGGRYNSASKQTQCDPYCLAGRYGSPNSRRTNQYCTGVCSSGYYCPAGSSSSTQQTCGSSNFYCQSGNRYIVPNGAYATGGSGSTTRTGYVWCQAAYYCVQGNRQCCPAGRYNPSARQTECKYTCPEGYYCPSCRSSPIPCGSHSSCRTVPTKCYCPAASGSPKFIASNEYTTPPTPGKESYRTGKAPCPPGYSCTNGVLKSQASWTNCDSKGNAERTVDENGAGGNIGDPMNAVGGSVSYTVSGLNRNSGCSWTGGTPRIYMHSTSGQLYWPSATYNRYIDFEKCSSFWAYVYATVGSSQLRCKVTFKVKDVNERPSIGNCGTRKIEEASVVNTDVESKLTVSDVDRGQAQLFSITGGTGANIFQINRCSGQIQVANSALLTYSKSQPSRSLSIMVTDTGTPALSASCTVTINILNKNDPPTYTGSSFKVNENVPVNTLVGTVSASDPDGDYLTYAIENPDNPAAFRIDASNGRLYVSKAVLDYETKQRYSFDVRASDGKLSALGRCVVELNDVNDPPSFSSGSTFYVAELSAVDTTVGGPLRDQVTDPEGASSFAFTITSGDSAGMFKIDSVGQIRVAKATLNYEATNTYNLRININDKGSPAASTTGSVKILLSDVNEAPSFNSNWGSVSVPENAAMDTVIKKGLTGTDPDSGQTLVYSVQSGDDNGFFRYKTFTGVLEVGRPLDFETAPAGGYKLTLRATDNGGLYKDGALTVVITNVNEQPVVVADQSFTIAENSAVNTKIGDPLKSTDPDGSGDPHTWSIKSGNTAGALQISSAGQLSVAKNVLDYEGATNSFNLGVEVKDAGGLTNTGTVSVLVTDVDEAPYLAEATPVKRSVAENSKVDTKVGAALNIKDPDAGAEIQCSIATNFQGYYKVDASTCQVMVAKTLPNAVGDASKDTHTIVVKATDGTDRASNPSVSVAITMANNNDAPTCSDTDRDIAENSPAGTKLGAPYQASDTDKGDVLRYEILSGDPGGVFYIDSKTGQVVLLKADLNYEAATNAYELYIKATDSAQEPLSATCKFEVAVTNVNEAPVIADATRKVTEGAAIDTPLGDRVAATDPDIGDDVKLIYSITAGNSGGLFKVNKTSGQLAVASTDINYEQSKQHLITLTVKDPGGLSAKAQVTIDVINANDPPKFPSSPVVVVREDAPVGSFVGSPVTATDEDGDALTYTMPKSSDVFSVDPTSGKVRVDRALDYETTKQYKFDIRASDGNGGIATVSVTVDVTDVNEPPKVTSASASVLENKPRGTLVATMSSTDPDAKDTATWNIIAGNEGETFMIESGTGRVLVKNAPDYEKINSFSLTVAAIDSAGLSGRGVLAVSITNVNEPPTLAVTRVEVKENSRVDTVFGDALRADDPDVGDSHTFAIVSGNDAGIFALGSDNKFVVKKAVLNYEAVNTYKMSVKVTDKGGLTATSVVTVAVTDINEPPTINDATVDVDENSPKNTRVGDELPATDPDVGQSLLFQIIAGNVGNVFKINSCSGQIQVNVPTLDYETLNQYKLTVQVTDDGPAVPGPARLSDTATITVKINDVNEAPVVTAASVEIEENKARGTTLHSVVAKDVDNGQSLTYSIQGGNIKDVFVINSATGVITVNNPVLDFETLTSYAIIVRATDNGKPVLYGEATVSVTVLNVNEPPVLAPGKREVPENSAKNTAVGDPIAAQDPDAGDSVSYSLSSGTPFAINSITGQITVANPVLDFEAKSSYSVTVTATDAGGLKAPAAFTIALIDVNEPPTINDASRTIPESAQPGDAVGAVLLASDPDKGQVLSFEIVSQSVENTFRIDARTGQLEVRSSALDYDKGVREYKVGVKVSDSGAGQLSDTATVTVAITNVNEAPVIAADQVKSVPENSPKDTKVGSVVAVTDEDANDSTAFAILDGNTKDAFYIDATGQIKINTPAVIDTETTPKYTLKIKVTDSGKLSDTKAVIVEVANVNEKPTFTKPKFTMNVAENAAQDLLIDAVEATDPDAGTTLTYERVSGDDVVGGKPIFKMTAKGYLAVAASGVMDTKVAKSYTLNIKVKDQFGLSDTAQILVNVVDSNEPPTILAQARKVPENSPKDTKVGAPIEATDEEDNTIEFTITAGNDDGAFAIPNKFSGQIVVLNPVLNYEATAKDENGVPTGKRALTVTATDTGVGRLSASATITIEILDVNEAPSVTDTALDVPENSAVGVTVGKAVASDPDILYAGDKLTYAISAGNQAGFFAIGATTGIITVAAKGLNQEAVSKYTLKVAVKDSKGATASGSVVIDVTDVNDAPVMLNQARSIAENSAVGTVVSPLIAAHDDDLVKGEQALVYSIVSGNDNAAFDIKTVENRGELSVRTLSALNFEQQASFTLVIKVVDTGVPALSAQATVTIAVKDVNEVPLFSQATYTVKVDENSPKGLVVGQVSAVDPEKAYQSVTYSIAGESPVWAINPADGRVSIKFAGVDYEHRSVYELEVLATDSNKPPLAGSATFRIEVQDVNEAPSISDATRDVDENSKAGTAVGLPIAASDPDGGQTLTYSLPKDVTMFSINAQTGQISVKVSPDYETKESYSMTVTVTDSDPTKPLSASATITVNINDVNEPPVLNDAERNVDENTEEAVKIGDAVSATDPDRGQILTYEIIAGNDDSLFKVDPCSGQLMVGKPALNYEKRSKYTLVYKVTDNGSPRMSDTANVFVTINDVNEVPTVRDTAFTIDENSAAGVRVGTPLKAEDEDNGQTHAWVITGGDDDDAFKIDSGGQILVTRNVLNYERRRKYELGVKATDSGRPALSGAAVITITVADVNEAPEIADAAKALPENSAVGFKIGTPLTASDVDGDAVTFSITGGEGTDIFAVSSGPGAGGGQLSVKKSALDFETKDTYKLVVTASDGELTTSATVTISLTDVNEPPTMIAATRKVPENSAKDTLVGVPVQGTDPDKGQKLVYAIKGGDSDEIFQVVPETGQLFVRRAVVLDDAGATRPSLNYEGTNKFLLQVSCTDSGAGSLTSVAVITVEVTNVNDAPVIADQARSIDENSADGDKAGLPVVATDEDAGDTLKFAIAGGTGSSKFAIDASSGQLTSNGAPLDFETLATYTVVIKVTDSGGKTASATITVAIQDVNEAPVVADTERSVQEKKPKGTVVGTPVQVVDQDTKDSHTFEITAGNSGDPFTIDANEGQIYVNDANLVALTKSKYTLTVKVTDTGRPAKSTTATVVVLIIENNDPPVVKDAAVSVAENVAAGTSVGQPVVATDEEGHKLTYTIVNGNVDDVFAISAATGQIRVAKADLNYEVRRLYILTVQAQDDGPGRMTGLGTVTVTLQDVNEAPVLLDASFAVDENSHVDVPVDSITGTDVDAKTVLTYRITAGNTAGFFKIDPSSGLISVAKLDLDFESRPSYTLTVTATDNGVAASGSGVLSDSAKVVIQLVDVNDPPSMARSRIEAPENLVAGTALGNPVLGTDEDRPQNVLKYTMSGDNCWGSARSTRFDYEFFPVTMSYADGGTSLTLRVKSGDTALVLLSPDKDVKGDAYELVLGGLGNTQVSLRRSSQGADVAKAAAVVLDAREWIPMWVTVNSTTGKVEVGKGLTPGAGSPLLEYTDASFFQPTHVAVAAGKDAADFRTVCFPTAGPAPSDLFELGELTGVLSMKKGAVANFEERSLYSIDVTVTDDASVRLSDRADVRITIKDVNENPVFADQCGTAKYVLCASVDENLKVGTDVGTVLKASDPDTAQNQKLAFAVQGREADLFAVDATTGQLSTKKSFDHENKDGYEVIVAVTDDGTPPLTTTATVQVLINDVNEAPTWTQPGGPLTIRENSPVGTLVGAALSADDVDDGDAGVLRFSVSGGSGAELFDVQADKPQVLVRKDALNFEATATYSLELSATDKGTPPLTTTLTIQIDLIDVNEPPVLEDTVREVVENRPTDSPVGAPLNASDPDIGQSLTYAVLGGDGKGIFNVNPCSGQIEVIRPVINFEVKAFYQLFVRVTDDGYDPANLYDDAVVNITVIDINEPPIIYPATRSVNENSALGVFVGDVLKTFDEDKPGDVLRLNITDGNKLGRFRINPVTGQLMVARAELNHEAQAEYILTVQVTDDGGLWTRAAITVLVADVNEKPALQLSTCKVEENVAVGTKVCDMTAIDEDEGQELTYSIVLGNNLGHFAIESRGNIGYVTAAGPLDFEQVSSYTLTITVMDDGVVDGVKGKALSDTRGQAVDIIDVNEAPVIEDATISLDEDVAHIVRLDLDFASPINATDPDNKALTYAIVAGNAEGFFKINPATAQMSVRRKTASTPPLNFEKQNQYVLKVKVTDTGFPDNVLDAVGTVTINVNDLNEAPTASDAKMTVPENSAAGTAVVGLGAALDAVQAADVDAADRGKLKFSITGGEGKDVFTIDADAGTLQVKDPAGLNYEADLTAMPEGQVRTVQVTVTDTGGLTGTATVQVFVSDVNEVPELHLTGYEPMVREKADIGTQVGDQIPVTDQDENSVLTFQVLASQGSNIFTVDQRGQILVKKSDDPLFVFTTGNIALKVKITDNGGLSVTADLSIKLLDQNWNPTLADYSLKVQENKPKDFVVGTVQGEDQDDGQKLTYSISGLGSVEPASAEGVFAIRDDASGGGKGAGVIYVADASRLNYEELSGGVILTVTVTDDGVGNMRGTGTVTITVENVNETPTAKDAAVSVPENSAVGTRVGDPIKATDPDFDDVITFTIALKDGGEGNPFTIDGKTGQISVGTATLDFETQSAYALVVTVTDKAGASSTAQVAVTVSNVNEAPQFDLTSAVQDVDENSAVGVRVGKVVATDVDSKFVPTVLTYTAASVGEVDASALFAIDSASGVITVESAALDYEFINSYKLLVTVTDSGPGKPLSTTTELTINLNDLPDLTVDGFSLDGKAIAENVEFPTVGGTDIFIHGTNMGRVDGKNPPALKVTYTSQSLDVGVFRPPYPASGCTIVKPNTVIKCSTAPGIGKDLSWLVFVGQWNATSKVTTAYKKPEITGASAAVALPTAGGASFTLVGDNFGPSDTFPVRVDYRAKDLDFGYRALNCFVGVPAHKNITCTSVPGVGHDLSFRVTIALQESEYFASTLTHAAPAISAIEGTTLLNTQGGEDVELVGTNMGPVSPNVLVATYGRSDKGPGSRQRTATSCVVTKAHERVRCKSVEGIGKDHTWKLSVGGIASASSVATTAYKPPKVAQLTGPGTEKANTKGGQQVIVVGEMFGAPGDDRPVVYYGPNAAPPPVGYAANCSVSLAHTELVCLTAPGTGYNHSWTVEIGGQRSPIHFGATSYAPPVVVEFTGPGSQDAVTPGGQEVRIEGRQFGTVKANKIDKVTYGETGTEFDVTSSCRVVKDHEFVACNTTAGAGRGLKWVVVIDRQASGVPTTFYAPPSITRIARPLTPLGQVQSVDAFATDGKEPVIILGSDFGPADPSYLESVTYGPTGVEYSAVDCRVESHTKITCLTAPGVGEGLKWYVTVKGQRSAHTDAAVTSYSAPAITGLSTTSGSTIGGEIITLNATNMGLATFLSNPRLSSVAIVWAGKELDAAQIGGFKRVGDQHQLWFKTQEAKALGKHRSVQLLVSDIAGRGRLSAAKNFSYLDPSVSGVFSINNYQSGLKELHIEGVNFGAQGRVEATFPDGLVKDLDCVFNDERGNTWTHTFIACQYGPSSGTVVVIRGEQKAEPITFEQRAPQIANMESEGRSQAFVYFNTEGGQTLTISGYDLGINIKDITVLVGENLCAFAADAKIEESKDSKGETVQTIKCTMPAGQGYGQPVAVINNEQPSSGRPINYEVPYIRDVTAASAPTTGLGSDGNAISFSFTGYNFGVTGQKAFLTRTDAEAGIFVRIPVACTFSYQELGSAATCSIPPGEGKDLRLELVLPEKDPTGQDVIDNPMGRYRHKAAYEAAYSAGQVSLPWASAFADSRGYYGSLQGTPILFSYEAPVVTKVSGEGSTQGGFELHIQGRNFGRPGAMRKVTLGKTFTHPARRLATATVALECAVDGGRSSHSDIYCTMPAGFGKDLAVTVDVLGQKNAPSSAATFSFKQPELITISPNEADTSALTADGLGVNVTLTGRNLGSFEVSPTPGVILMQRAKGDDGPALVVDRIWAWTHTSITFLLPPEQGSGRVVEVHVGDQSNAAAGRVVRFSYRKPSITSIVPDTTKFERKDDLFPTKGGYAVDVHGTSMGHRRPKLYITDGQNVFEPVMAKYLEDDFPLDKYPLRPVLHHDHFRFQFVMPPGMGADLDLVFQVGDEPPASAKLSYDPPRIEYIQPYPADSEGSRLTIKGANFGSPGVVDTGALEVIINDLNCTDPKVVAGKAVRADQVPEPYIECEMTRQLVGHKNISVHVARQKQHYRDFEEKLETYCWPGSYGQRGEHCLKCPRGAYCAGGHSKSVPGMYAEPISIEGWWLKNVTDELSLCPEERLTTRTVPSPHCPYALPCEPKAACAGNNTCTIGYRGERCALCDVGYYRRAGECVECPDNPWILVAGFLGAALCMCVAGYFLNKKSVNLAFISIGVDYFQILALFANSRVSWPPFIKYLFHLMSVFNFNLEITAPECSIPDLGYIMKWSFVMALPIAAVVIFLSMHFYQLFKKRFIQGRRKKLNAHVHILVATSTVLMYYLYLYLTRTTLDVFNCSPTDPPDGHEYLEVVFERCDEPGGIHETLLPFAIITLFLYTLGYPTYLATNIYRNRMLIMEDQLLRASRVDGTRLNLPNTYELRKRLHKMYYHFKPDYFYWILVIIGRKFLIAFTALMFNKNPAFQLSMALLVMFTAYALQVRHSPYMSMSEHEAVLKSHEAMAAADDGSRMARIHSSLAQVLVGIRSRGKRGGRKFDWDAGGAALAAAAAQAAATYFFDYNTVESVLLACAVLINLAGIMFESGRFESEYYATQRDVLTVAVMVIIFFSVTYFAFVFLSEVHTTVCKDTKRGRQKALEKVKEEKRKTQAVKRATMAAQAVTMSAEGGGGGKSDSAAFNPLFAAAATETSAEDASKSIQELLASDKPPSAAAWAQLRVTVNSQMDKLNESMAQAKDLNRRVQELEAGGAAVGAVVVAGGAGGAGGAAAVDPKKAARAAARALRAAGTKGKQRRMSKKQFGQTAASSSEAALPENWTSAVDPGSGKVYYYNVMTRQRQWSRPSE